MEIVKKLLFTALVALVLVSCSDDDKKEGKDGDITDQNDPDLVVDDLQGNITGDITLAADQDWVLTGPLVVQAGGSLTIEAGTVIHAQAGGTNVYIAVERNAQIFVEGTAASPVTITSNAAEPAEGDWGGVLIMGNATITGGTTAVTEVVDFIYGNNPANNADNSGSIEYLILEYTGARINGEKEFNGLTLYGVGNGTTISNVAVFYGDDDAFEWFGGTVNATNLLAVNCTDDMFDWTQGYSGTITNAYGIREDGYTKVSSDPRGIEGDGNLDGLTPGLNPQSNPTVTNITFVNNSTAVIADFIKIRRGSNGNVTNALVIQGANAPAPGDVVDLDDALGTANAATTVNVTISGTNLDAANIDNTGTNGTISNNITFPGVANTGANTGAFGWTGYFN
jgi:hypothetical protein